MGKPCNFHRQRGLQMGTDSPLNERHLLIEIHTKPNPPVSTVLMLRPCAEGIVYTVRRGWAYKEK